MLPHGFVLPTSASLPVKVLAMSPPGGMLPSQLHVTSMRTGLPKGLRKHLGPCVGCLGLSGNFSLLVIRFYWALP